MYTGSMIGSGAAVFAVMGYVIANTNSRSSLVELNPALLAFIIGEPETAIVAAIEKLCATDAKSRQKVEDGRRLIRRGEFEYFVVNFRHYRDLLRKEQRNAYMAELMAEKREKERANRLLTGANSPVYADASASGSGVRGVGEGERPKVAPEISDEPPPPPAHVPTLAECVEYASNPACGFPPALVREWYYRQQDRGWGNDWRARMISAVATYREMAFKRKIVNRQAGADVHSKKPLTFQPAKPAPGPSRAKLQADLAILTSDRDAVLENAQTALGKAKLAELDVEIRRVQKLIEATK
jgi:hypothetical protein